MVEGKPYAVARDVAVALGYSKPINAIATHCKGTLKQGIVTDNRGIQEMLVIPQGDIVRLAVKCKLAGADRFESWIFDEVMPSVMNHGMYAVDELLANPELLLQAGMRLKAERKRRLLAEQHVKLLEAAVEEQKPMVEGYRRFLDSDGYTDMASLAKILGKDFDDSNVFGRNKFMERLRRTKILTSYNTPYQHFINSGYFVVVKTTRNGKNFNTTLITAKGIDWLFLKLRKDLFFNIAFGR